MDAFERARPLLQSKYTNSRRIVDEHALLGALVRALEDMQRTAIQLERGACFLTGRNWIESSWTLIAPGKPATFTGP